jgi:hypothetical protein
MGLQTIPADPLTPYQLSNDVYNSIFAPSDQQSWYGNLKKYSVLNENETNGSSIIRLKGSVDFKDQWNGGRAEKMDGSELLSGGALEQLKTLRPLETDSSTRKLWINETKSKKGNIILRKIKIKLLLLIIWQIQIKRVRQQFIAQRPICGLFNESTWYQVDPQLVNAN